MEKYVEVEVNYTDNEVKKALMYFIIHINRIGTVFVCFLAVISILLAYGFVNGFSNYIKVQTVVISVCGLLLYMFYYHIPVRRYTDFYRQRKGGTYTFSQKNIKIVGEEIQSICAWSIFKKAYNAPNAFLLVDENNFLYVFSKSCFKSRTDEELLQQLLLEKIKGFKIHC
ncbi:MAG: hypothetical protein N2645_02960 [Clostridia bacterium]|nr:hypothetical protein [Clostridia bacterium]